MPALLQEGAFYLLLLLLPFSKAAIEITSVLLIGGWLAERWAARTRRQTVWVDPAMRPLRTALIAFFVVCGLSIVVSHDPRSSAEAWIGKWGQYLMLLVVAADLGRRSRIQRASLCVMAISAALVIFESVHQERMGCGFFFPGHRLDFFSRMTGPYENPIDLATYFMVIIPIAFMASMGVGWPPRVALWGLSAAMVGCVARANSFGVWLGLFLALAALVALSSARARRIGLALFAGGLIGWSVWMTIRGEWRIVLSTSEIGKTDRIAMWQAALGMIRDRPVLGHGLNTFMSNYLHYWVGGERQPRYAHNCFLQVAAETGLIGLLAFVACLGCLFARLAKDCARLPRERRLALQGCFAGLLAFVAQSAIDTNFYSLRQAALFWTLAGVALGLGRSAVNDARPSEI